PGGHYATGRCRFAKAVTGYRLAKALTGCRFAKVVTGYHFARAVPKPCTAVRGCPRAGGWPTGSPILTDWAHGSHYSQLILPIMRYTHWWARSHPEEPKNVQNPRNYAHQWVLC